MSTQAEEVETRKLSRDGFGFSLFTSPTVADYGGHFHIENALEVEGETIKLHLRQVTPLTNGSSRATLRNATKRRASPTGASAHFEYG